MRITQRRMSPHLLTRPKELASGVPLYSCGCNAVGGHVSMRLECNGYIFYVHFTAEEAKEAAVKLMEKVELTNVMRKDFPVQGASNAND